MKIIKYQVMRTDYYHNEYDEFCEDDYIIFESSSLEETKSYYVKYCSFDDYDPENDCIPTYWTHCFVEIQCKDGLQIFDLDAKLKFREFLSFLDVEKHTEKNWIHCLMKFLCCLKIMLMIKIFLPRRGKRGALVAPPLI